jgi:hypothetical protein
MLITYLRSSSAGGYEWCPHKYLLERVLGFPGSPNLKADKGNVVHKALELLAGRKKAEQESKGTFVNEELGREFVTADMVPNLALDLGYAHYSNPKRTPHKWTAADEADCRGWMWDVLKYNDGMFSPLKREIVQPEQYFDYEIDKPWAQYNYKLPDGSSLKGRLALKGTVDLLTRVRPGVLEYLDWKTGQRKNWKTGQTKEYKDFKEDFQLRLYHHALSRLYPGEQIFMTIFFIRDGGPFTLCFEDKDLPRTEEIIRHRYEAIKNDNKPRLIYKPGFWKCERLCEFFKQKWPGTDKTTCRHMADELQTLGMDRLVEKYADLSKLNSYGAGGGKEKRD